MIQLDNAQKERLLARLEELNADIRNRGIIRYAPTWMNPESDESVADMLTGYAFYEFYDWDLYFENIYLAHYGVHRFCRTNLEAFLDRQLRNGFVSRCLKKPRPNQHFKPFLAQIAVLGVRQSGRLDWLEGKYYGKLKHYLDYWFWFCDQDKNGLSSWDSSDHSGMDNQFSRAGHQYDFCIEGVDLNSYLHRELQAMQVLADAFGLGEDKATFAEQATTLATKINETLWDETRGFYFDRNDRTGERVNVRSCSGFMPLFAGIASKAQAKRLVEEHLLDPEAFWLKYPIASYAKDEPDYYQTRTGEECNWRGSTWIPVNYMLTHALKSYGYTDIANELAAKTFEMVLAEDTTREFYNGETGCGQGLSPFWGWSSLAYTTPFELDANWNPLELTLDPLKQLVGPQLNIKFK